MFYLQSLSSPPMYKSRQDSYDISDMDADSKDFIKTETQQLLADGNLLACYFIRIGGF